MFGWSIIARACRSASKRARTCRLSMPGLMTFRATLPPQRVLLLGHVDQAHAPFADLLHQLVGADRRAGSFRGGLVDGGIADRRAPEELAGVLMGLQQLLDTAAQLGLALACIDRGSTPAPSGDSFSIASRKIRFASGMTWLMTRSERIGSTNQCPVWRGSAPGNGTIVENHRAGGFHRSPRRRTARRGRKPNADRLCGGGFPGPPPLRAAKGRRRTAT